MKDFETSPVDGIAIELKDDSITSWNVLINGPEDSPYKGG